MTYPSTTLFVAGFSSAGGGERSLMEFFSFSKL